VNINPLAPNDPYRDRTAQLTSKVAFYIFIQQISVLNILNMEYTLRFFSSKRILFHNANVFGSCIIHVLYTGCAKIKKIIPAPKSSSEIDAGSVGNNYADVSRRHTFPVFGGLSPLWHLEDKEATSPLIFALGLPTDKEENLQL